MRNVFIWLVINAVSAFNLKCPHAGEWNHTAEARNCSSTNYYCLFDDVKLKNAANCSTEPRTERKGFKAVLNKGNFNRKACSLNHFQPFQFSSYKNSECVLEKSLCSEEGQVIADTGTSIRDGSCRCNYHKGYAILANTSNLCSCTPSGEDCTCFKKTCSDSEILSPDYKCIKRTELEGIHQCPTISDRGSLTPVTDVVPIVLLGYDKVYILYATTCCTIILVIIIVLSVCVIFCWKQTKRKIWHVWTYLKNCCRKINFIKQLEDQSCNKGGSVTFTCEVNHKNIPARWSKDEQELKPSESFSITAVGKVHVLVIHSVTAKDSGKYACHIKDKNSSAQLIVKEVIIVKQLEDQNCFEGGSVTFTCEVNHNDIPARWSKNGQELKPSESISITAVGNVHKIVIHSVTATDSGKYACHINDKNSSAQLTVKEVIIVKQLEDQNCFEGGSVTFTCEVNHNDIPARWSKNGQELKPSESISITAVGNVHKIVIHSVTATDSGKYACHINDKNSSAQLTVKEVIIVKQLENQSCDEGCSVTFTCEVNHNDIPARWSKNGQELKASESISITAVGNVHKIVIHSVTATDSGKYAFHINDKNSSAQLIVKEVIIIKQLENQSCNKGCSVTFTCEVNKNDISARWSKNGQELKASTSIKITAVGRTHQLVIDSVTANDKGKYSCHILDKNSSAQLTVKEGKMATCSNEPRPTCLKENQNYGTLDRLLKDLAETVVRKRFDKEFDPTALQKTLNRESLKLEKLVNKKQWNILFPRDQKPVCSSDFDLTLMILLIRNLTLIQVSDILPVPNDSSQGADISRIKYYRNELAHCNGKISDIEFEQQWVEICQALVRLGGESYKEICAKLKVTSLSSGKGYGMKIIIVKQLEDQSCNKGGSVTFTCEVNQNDIPASWSKNGQELKASESISITAVGNVHKIVIHSVTAIDSGKYACHINDKKSSAQLTVKEVFISKQLEDQNSFGGGSVTFTCEVNKTNIPGKWNKDGQELKETKSKRMTAVGRIHKLVIDSVTANDKGKYSFHIKNDDSSAQLIVSEVTFINKFKDQQCFEGETVIFTCEVSQENVPGKWRKDGIELVSSESKKITVIGRTHNLVIHSVTLNDKGYYLFKVTDKASGAYLSIEDTKYIKLFHLLKTVAEPVIRKIFDREIHPDHLKQTLSKGKNKIDKLKKHKNINWREYDLLYPKVVEYSVKFKIKNHDYSQIQGNEEEDKRIRAEILHDVSALFNSVQGIHKVEILDLESGSLIAVIKLTASQVFDTLKSTIESAVKEGKIGSFETDSDEFIFQKLGNLQVPITSQNFDIRLMMILMKNLIEAYDNIPDVLPFETDITEVADLSRVKHIRNKIVQNSDRSISDEDFEEDWSNLSQALIRLGGESVAEECKTLKEYQPTPQQSKDYLNPENLQCDQGSISNESLTDDFVQETLMNNSARYAVRQIFDKQFPPQALQKEIENQKQPLRNLKEHRGITQSQWDDLFPREKESLSSARFDIKVMIILLSNTSFKDKEIFKTIENLQNCLSRPKEYRKAIMQAIKEINEEELSWR